MIDLKQLNKIHNGFYFFSHLLDYPTDEIYTTDFSRQFEDQYPEDLTKDDMRQIITAFQAQPILELQKQYTALFELNRRVTLYMSYYRFEDSRERGELLAKLKMLYEMFGVESIDKELTDYLPLMLEFLAYGDWQGDYRSQDLKLLFSVIEDGTFNVIKNSVAQADSPYIHLLTLCRQELGTCMIKEVEV